MEKNVQFPRGFIFGAATSSYQIEGGWNDDGKGLSIWDAFSHISGNIANDENGDIACDHYHRYKEDVSIMKEMNLMGYRFSLSWPRIFPEGRGRVNEAGAQFYDNLIDELLHAQIEPNITLYHWDLPLALSNQGGWTNRQVIDDFVKYAEYCFRRYGDRVRKWSTFNEAYIVANLGYEIGKFAPGLQDPLKASQVSHHLNLAHAKVVRCFRELQMSGEIGIVHCMSPVHNMDGTESGAQKAQLVDGLWNRWCVDPSLKGEYPEDIMSYRKTRGTAPLLLPGDMDVIRENRCDYLGVNYYFRFRVYDTGVDKPFDWAECVNCKPIPDAQYTDFGWEIYPDGVYQVLKRIRDDYGDIPLYITENGMAAPDDNREGEYVKDDDRLDYIRSHLRACREAIDEGVNLKGFYYWSLMDNFEWASGYAKKFGIVRVNFDTLSRTIKKSGRWYADFILGQKGNLTSS